VFLKGADWGSTKIKEGNFLSRALVTGGMGFIGSYTVDELVSRGYDVTVLDSLERQVHRTGRKPQYANKKARYLNGDIRSVASWKKALRDCDCVIHLGAVVGVGQSFWQARKYLDINVTGTGTLYELLVKEPKIKNKLKKIVVASSKSLYGEGSYVCETHGKLNPGTRPSDQLRRKEWEVKCPICSSEVRPVGITEDKPPQNASPYALSKYATEILALDYSFATGIPSVAFRYFNVYGPRQSLSNPYTGVIALFLSRIKNEKPPTVFEDGKQLRDFVFVEDVARLNVDAIENKAEGAFNLGTGKSTSLLDIITALKKLEDSSVEPNLLGEFRPGDNRHDYADISKLRNGFPSVNFTEFETGLQKLGEWSKTSKAVDLFEREEKERRKYLSQS
jgi:dTDP-L-rhamnose 4-epimerase